MSDSKEEKFENDDYDEIANMRLSKKDREELKMEAFSELSVLEEMQEQISKAFAGFLSKEKMGIVSFNEKFKTSSKQTNKIMKGEANLTLATLAEFSQRIGKRPRLVFEDELES